MSIPDLDTEFEELLASNLTDKASSNSKLVLKNNYRDLQKFGNVTSYSMQQGLHTCPRLFQISKMEADMPQASDYIEEDNPDFAFGHAVGAGVATYDETQDLDQAMWACFLAWNIDLFARKEKKERRPDPNKSYAHACWAVKMYATFYEEELCLQEYEVVKNEATIAVDFENGHFYVGHIDTLLRSRDTGQYKVKENKTTVYTNVHPSLYSNSEQALSYALVVDTVGASEYSVLYCIYSSSEMRWMSYEFHKDTLAKAQWLQDQAFIHSTIDMYEDHNFFPKRGGSCSNQFGKPCKYYESCDFDSAKVYGKNYSALRKLGSLAELEEIEHIDYAFTWSEIVARQKENLNAV